MPTAEELTAGLWSGIKSDMTLMLGINGEGGAHMRPMTAQLDGDRGPIWFFTSRDSDLVRNLSPHSASAGAASFTAKDHDLFAFLEGKIRDGTDPAVIDRLWNRFVAAWYAGGQTDPKLVLLRFDVESAEIWRNGSGLIAGLQVLLGADPKEEYKDNAAKVELS